MYSKAVQRFFRRNVKDAVVSHEPYSPELEDFIISSRMYQTNFLNYEGRGRKLEVQYDQKDVIEEFITVSLFFDKMSDDTGEMYDWLQKKVKGIAAALIQHGKMVNSDKIHFGVLWVNYFVHEERKHKCFPLFKIYKNSGAIFLDACLNVFSNWEHFISEAALPKALLCIPRNGEYHFMQGQLDLEYMQSKACVQELTLQYAVVCLPLSEVGGLPWIKKLQSFFHQLQSGVLNMVLKIKESYPIPFYIAAASLAVASTALVFVPRPMLRKFCYILINIAVRSADNIAENRSNLFSVLKAVLQVALSASAEGLKILKLLDDPKKNFVEIFQSICLLLTNISPVTKGENLPLKAEGKNDDKQDMKKDIIAASESVSDSCLNNLTWVENREGITKKIDLSEFWADFELIWGSIMPELSIPETHL